MIRRHSIAALVLALLCLPASAQNEGPSANIAGYTFLLGDMVTVDDPGVERLFAAGSTVRVQSSPAGSAYAAGRIVDITGSVKGDAFAAGMEISLVGPVSGDASVMGSNVAVGRIGGNLRASAGTLTLSGPVAGYAVISGDDVKLENTVTGDLYVNARNISFGDDARVDGRLVIFGDKADDLKIPVSIASEDRVERQNASAWESAVSSLTSEPWQNQARSFLTGALVIAVLASMIAVLIPKTLADLRRGLHDQPFRNLWFGFLTESATVGAAIVLAVILISVFAATLLGLLVIPVSLAIALVTSFAGYVVASYVLGVGLLMLMGRPEPDGAGARILAAVTGALLASAAVLIPFIGWPIALVLVLAGVGALTLKLFRPSFHAGVNSAGPG